jgi:transposase
LTRLRHALSDEHYAIIEPLLPTNARPGHPWKGHRVVIDGILWVLHTGAPWRDLPRPTYGPWQTVYERFNRWSKDGAWGRLLEALHVRLDAQGKIDWDLFCIDGSSIRAGRDAAGASATDGTPSEPADHALGRSRGGYGSKIHLVCDGRGRSRQEAPRRSRKSKAELRASVESGLRILRTQIEPKGGKVPGRPLGAQAVATTSVVPHRTRRP